MAQSARSAKMAMNSFQTINVNYLPLSLVKNFYYCQLIILIAFPAVAIVFIAIGGTIVLMTFGFCLLKKLGLL